MTPRTLRLKLDYNLDPSDSEVTIEAVKSNAFNIEFGIFQEAIPYDLNGLTSVTMVIRPARGTATNLAAITLAYADLTPLPNSVRWNRGTMQHGIFEWTTAQMNQTVTGDYDDYWWSCYALLTTNEEVTLGNGVFRIYESNIANGGVPPVNPGATITADEADARYVRYDAATSLTGGQQTQARENIDADNAANLSSGIIPDARMPNLTGDITTVEGAVATTLATVNSNVGSFGSATAAVALTVNAKGLVTAASAATITPAESSVTFTDITTNNATSLKHGYLPKLSGSATDVLKGDGTWASASAGSGTVTSVAMSVPSILSVAGSPITTSGTLAVTLATQAANLVFAGPATGADATPTFRSLVAADIPSLSATYLTVANPTATGEFNLSDSGTLDSWQFTPGSHYFRFIDNGGFGVQFDVTAPTADRNIFVPNASGTMAVSASGNIALSAAGAITFTGTLPVANGGTGITALGTGVATWLGTPTIANLNSAVSDADLAILGANTFTALQAITQASANAGILASTGYSLTGTNATNMVDLAGTWNTSGTPTAFKLNITDTASNASSLLFDFQVGGVSRGKLLKNSTLILCDGGYVPGSLYMKGLSGSGTLEIGRLDQAAIAGISSYSNGGVVVGTGRYYCFSNSSSVINGSNVDLFLARKAAATLQLGRDAAGVTDQMLTAASRITSDGVGANLTIAGGNGRGGAGGSLIFSTYDTQGAGTIGNLTTRLTIDTAGLSTFSGATMIDGSADVVQLTVQGHSSQTAKLFVVENSSGTDVATIANNGVLTCSEVDIGSSSFAVYNNSNVLTLYVAGNICGASADGFKINSSKSLGWSNADMNGTLDAFFVRKAAATIQLGTDAAGVTNQMFTAASRITSDGVGANLTIAGGNGRGGAGGSLIFSTYDTQGAATIGTLTTRLTLDTAGLLTFADAVDMAFNATTGTKIGTATTQKIGFWNSAPSTQPTNVTNPSGGAIIDAEARTAIDSILSRLETIGLFAA